MRYQTLLLTSALVFLSFGLLEVSSFKMADPTIALDWKALLLFGLFLLGVAAIFSFRHGSIMTGQASAARDQHLLIV